MSEGREQDQPDERERASRPVTAAARRERRGSARPAGRKDAARSAEAKPSKEAAKADSDAEATRKGKPTRAREDREKRPSIFARLIRYVREVVSELRKVIWPTRKQMVTYTSVVLVFVAFMVALVFGLDAAFAWGVFRLFG
ncbi:preprotein translocase subunit SecE [Saccharothrix coeruleofusca]|uniref:Protein translocase subunit SecE n=1 Tax=Saccharothrix coeruleofusca TaxID=33919 RepID=A0A918AMJ4_9PSEU|nr:preprotein translocase subunit SecE [Saccharothrix coeruleofusca]MBP2339431.1 preprotein translocase subunit SecE [Saccharothrix coeruleofusca]GGP57719.1 protein translocase subunit SecE [Saccharothrix coeruleofusca]